MDKGLTKKRTGQWIALGLMYIGFVLIRYWLGCLTAAFPTVGIDEFLYYSLGRSIAAEGKLLYRGQPALYNYIIYPLALAPLYAVFPEGADFYRIIQFWNCLLMNLAIVPIYQLCGKIFGKGKKALGVTALLMLLPDFSLSEFIFSEAVIYPLFFTLIYLIYVSLEEKTAGRMLWIGILGAVLYYTKPGAVVPAIAALGFFLIQELRGKNRKNTVMPLIGIAGLIGGFAALWAVARFGLGYQGGLLSVYHEQLETEGKMYWDVFLKTAALYPYYFMMACGILPAVYFLSRLGKLEKNAKRFFGILLVSLAAVMIGTAWAVNRSEHTYILFLRYMAMYIPPVLLGCLMPMEKREEIEEEVARKRLPVAGVLSCIYLAVCTAIWGCTAGIGGYIENHFLVSLAILVQPNIKGIWNILVYVMAGVSLYLVVRKIDRKKMAALCCGAAALCMVINNIGGYVATGSNGKQVSADEAYHVQKDLIHGDDYLYIFSNERVSDFGLDVYTKSIHQQLEWYDFFNDIHANGGAYAPFVPVAERGMREGGETPDVNVLVVERTTYPLIKFSENMQGGVTENGLFYVGRFEKGARIVDAMLANVENFLLLYTDYGVLTLYKPEWIGHKVRITLDIESQVEQNMRFFADDDHSVTIPLVEGRASYQIEIPAAAIGYNFVVDKRNINVYGFNVETMEE